VVTATIVVVVEVVGMMIVDAAVGVMGGRNIIRLSH
jgi:hypothetical protein